MVGERSCDICVASLENFLRFHYEIFLGWVDAVYSMINELVGRRRNTIAWSDFVEPESHLTVAVTFRSYRGTV